MMELPSVKENPVMVAIVTVLVIIAVYVGGIFTGYYWRISQEDSANLLILVDDEKAEKRIENELNDDLIETYNNAEVLNSYEETDCSKCLGSNPLPNAWFTIMQSDRDNESRRSD